MIGTALFLGLAAGCELQTEIQGSTTIYSQSTWTAPFGMGLGLVITIAGVALFRTRLPRFIRRYGIAAAAIGIVFFALGMSVIGTYVEVSPYVLRGRTGVIWDRYTYDIPFQLLREIRRYKERGDVTDKDAIKATFYVFVYETGEEVQIKRDGYLKAAESEMFEHAQNLGVDINIGEE